MLHLQQFIKENEDWVHKLESLNIKIKEDNDLYIFNYGVEADFSDPIVKECRGIILNKDFEVVCRGFDKFGNYNEYYVDDIDWDTARVQEKVDGSIIKLYYYDNEWRWATNGMIDANKAMANSLLNHSFYDLIKKANNYRDIPFNELDKDYTYIFELVSPENRIVVEYNEYMLYHLGTRNNKTGQEIEVNIGIIKPKQYDISDFDTCLATVNQFNKDSDNVDKEGFVVVDKDYHRIKVKSEEYMIYHHIIENGNLSKKRCIEIILNNKELMDKFKQYEHIFKYYEYKVAELYYNVNAFIQISRDFYAEYSYDRKAVALKIKHHKYAQFGFKGLDNELTAEDMLDIQKITNLVEDYVPVNFLDELS